MSYLGNEPPQLAGYSTQTKAAPVGSSIALDQEGTINSTLLFLDGVRQTPTTDYTISGTTLTLTSTAPTAAVATILFLGDVTDIGQPSNDTVDVDQLNTTSVGTTGQFLKKTGASTVDWGTVTTDTSGIEDDIALLGFKVAVNGSLAKYNLVDQTEDAFMDATGIDASASTDEFRNASNYYSGVSGTDPTGGTISTYTDGADNYRVHSFLADGSFVVASTGAVDYLIVGGGGGGGTGGSGAYNAGAGGAGGFRTSTGLSISGASYAITVGDGGATNTVGEDSVFNALTSSGGGTGAFSSGGAGGNGGSGGGGAGHGSGGAGGTGNTPSTSPSQGNDGGSGSSAAAGGAYGGAGGGGATAVGANGTSSAGGNGGAGTANSLRTNVAVTYAGGGGGAASSGSASTGGAGGGGAGGVAAVGSAGTVNLGGGGGAGSGIGASHVGGAGGSGIVVIRYLTNAFTTHSNMELVSNATTANDGAPTKGDIVMTYTNGLGTATLNTDLTAEYSANDGVAWTPMTLVAQGSTGTAAPSFIVSAHDVTLATASGTAMRYRIKTLNQGAAKETRIQAVSLGWS
jgi:hypothetical protein